MHEPFADCADTPAEHDAAEPGGRRDFPDDDVGGDFEEDVSAFINISHSWEEDSTHGMKKMNKAML
jgi:hypothetical protein